MDHLYCWVWEQESGYTADVTRDHADAWMRALAHKDKSNAHRRTGKAAKMSFKWREHEHDLDTWEPRSTFSEDSGTSNPRGYLTIGERRKVREAARELGTIPAYGYLSPDQRDRWRAHLAQRFEKPKFEVRPVDWDRANGWKIPSLTWVSLDPWLRPTGRAVTSWVNVDNEVLRIPRQKGTKNNDNWIVSPQSRTAQILEHWLEERAMYEKYEDTDRLRLTRESNPYDSSSLLYLLDFRHAYDSSRPTPTDEDG